MKELFVTEDGAKIRIKKNRFVITKDDECINELPIYLTSNIVFFSHSQITGKAVIKAVKNGIKIWYSTKTGKLLGYVAPVSKMKPEILIQQCKAHGDKGKSIYIAKQIIKSKIHNMMMVLERKLKRLENKETVYKALEEIDLIRGKIDTISEKNRLFGVEGSASRAYFKALGTTVKEEKLRFRRRTKRPPKDAANALISLTYSLLTTQTIFACLYANLEPSIGYLHKTKTGRPALALDLVEPFRPLADRFVVRICNLKIIRPEDIVFENNTFHLGQKGFKKYISQFHDFTVGTHPTVKNYGSGFEILSKQAKSLYEFLMKNTSTFEVFKLE